MFLWMQPLKGAKKTIRDENILPHPNPDPSPNPIKAAWSNLDLDYFVCVCISLKITKLAIVYIADWEHESKENNSTAKLLLIGAKLDETKTNFCVWRNGLSVMISFPDCFEGIFWWWWWGGTRNALFRFCLFVFFACFLWGTRNALFRFSLCSLPIRLLIVERIQKLSTPSFWTTSSFESSQKKMRQQRWTILNKV